MNGRIQEIAEQAREFVRKQMLLFQEADMSQRDAKWAELYNTKFAELIVEECAEAVENSIWHLPRGYKATDQAEFVKKHFGLN